MDNNKITGNIGETYARKYLINKGYNIVCTNYRCKLGEIDIISSYKNYIIFVEVKYRKTILKGYPREAVNIKKQNKIRNTANFFIINKNIKNKDFRFDVIEILGDSLRGISITHIENVF